MFITGDPVHYNPHIKDEHTFPDTTVKVVDDNTLEYDGQVVAFPENEIAWPEILINTNGKIRSASRDENGKIHLKVKILFSKMVPRFADLQEHEIQDGETL